MDFFNIMIAKNQNSNISLDHTVIFTVDGAPYEIVSVKNGNSVNAPATEPTSESGNFAGWNVTFPYTPTSDAEIIALLQTVRSEIELNNAGDIWVNNITKKNDGWAIVGYALNGTAPYFCMVSDTEYGAKAGAWSPTSFTYNDQTYYYLIINFTTVSNYGKCTEVITYNDDKVVMATELLDYYFMVEPTPTDTLYDFYGVSKTDYPYLFVSYDNYKKVKVIFTNGYQITSDGAMFLPNAPHLYGTGENVNFTDYDNIETALTIAMEKVTTLQTLDTAYNYSGHIYTNADTSECADNFYSL